LQGRRFAYQSCSATDAVALPLKNTHTLRVSEFQFGGDSSMLFV